MCSRLCPTWSGSAGIVPHVQLVTIPGCGHFANIERPEQVQRLLTDLRPL